MGLRLAGLLLFLFIPLVLFLFVVHPEPLGLSLGAGVVLMIGHRRLARPYMMRSLPVKCLWCNRLLAEGGPSETLELQTGGGPLTARCCPGHRPPAARFFAWLDALRWPLRAGIFVPLLLLLGTLALAAFGQDAPLPPLPPLPIVTAWFKLLIGVTVNLAALGPLVRRERSAPEVPFPAHNFFLLGVRNLLWVFRLVGVWWIWQGLRYLAE